MVTVSLSVLFTKDLLIQLLINVTTLLLVKTLLKDHYNNHTCCPMKRTLNCRSMYELKEEDINYFISRNIAMKSQKYVCGSRKCDLCKCEKLLILRADQNVLLNEHDEFV